MMDNCVQLCAARLRAMRTRRPCGIGMCHRNMPCGICARRCSADIVAFVSRIDMCVDTCMDMHVDMRIDNHMDMCTDTWMNMRKDVAL